MTSEKSGLVETSSKIFLACGLLLLIAGPIVRSFSGKVGHDQLSYLIEAQRFISGDVIYGPHISETNPPMIIWFSSLPVLLGSWLHGSPTFFLRALVVAMILASVAWCGSILARAEKRRFGLPIFLFMCAIFWVDFGVRHDFAQREHLSFILMLPYVLAAATSLVSRLTARERCALGMVAAVSLWFKPQDIIILVALELFLALRAKSLRRALAIEVISLVLGALFILLLVRALTPLYLTSVVPLLTDLYWGLGDYSALTLALSLHTWMALLIPLLVACLLLKRMRDSPTILSLIVCSIAGSLAYDIQHTDWEYHAYPHRAFLLCALAFFLIELLDPFLQGLIERQSSRRYWVYTASAFALMLTITASTVLLARNRTSVFGKRETANLGSADDLDQYLAQIPRSTTITIYSTSVLPLAAIYEHGLNSGSRFAHLWMMPAIIQDELGPKSPSSPFKQIPPDRLTALASLQRGDVAEDLNYWHPTIVLVELCAADNPCQGIGQKQFDMLAWFQKSADFDAAWSRYRKHQTLSHYAVYTLE